MSFNQSISFNQLSLPTLSTLTNTLRTIIESKDLSAFTSLLQTYCPDNKNLIASAVDDDGRNFLHWIAEKGLIPFLTHSLSLGFDPDAMLDEDEWTPLHVAAANGHDQIVLTLIKGGSQINRTNGGSGKNSALHIAAGKGHVKVCQVIIASAKQANILHEVIELINGQNFTPLQRAVYGDKTDVVKLLLESGGANPDVRDYNTGETLLHIASGNKNQEMIRLLIESRPSLVNECDNRGYKPYYCNDGAVIEVYRDYIDLIDEGDAIGGGGRRQ